jgi:hypothetical protein
MDKICHYAESNGEWGIALVHEVNQYVTLIALFDRLVSHVSHEMVPTNWDQFLVTYRVTWDPDKDDVYADIDQYDNPIDLPHCEFIGFFDPECITLEPIETK